MNDAGRYTGGLRADLSHAQPIQCVRRCLKDSRLPPILTVDQAAAFLQVSKHIVYEEIRQDRLPHIKLGIKLILIPRTGLQQWIEHSETRLC